MTPPIAFDPSAIYGTPPVDGKPVSAYVEASLRRGGRTGRLALRIVDESGEIIATLDLRSDFLDEIIQHARAREEDAA